MIRSQSLIRNARHFCTGFYGQKFLRDNNSINSKLSAVIDECTLLHKIAVKSSIHSSNQTNLVKVLDGISARLCLFLDSTEACASTHQDAAMRNAARDAYGSLIEFVTKLNMDSRLYRPLAQLVNSPDLFNQLDLEEKQIALSLKLEFERDGIHVSDDEKGRIEKIQGDIRKLESRFSSLQASAYGSISLSLDETRRTMMHVKVIPEFKEQKASLDNFVLDLKNSNENFISSISKFRPPSELHIPVDESSMNTVLRTMEDESIRKKFYMHAHSSNGLEVLSSLVHSRHSLSKSLGFESYAHYATSFRLVKHPDVVDSFLNELSLKVIPRASIEIEMLAKAKRDEGLKDPLSAWDIRYYQNTLYNEHFGDELSDISRYFSVETCLQGLFMICSRLFGLQFNPVAMSDDEKWASDVDKLQVTDCKGDVVGILYLDLYRRSGKYPNPAHFQIQCSHLARPMSSYSIPCEEKSRYQTPTSMLVCSFQDQTSLLQHSQVTTLFHEFGHALHSLLSRTQFQHLSGTRGELDFVETPSQLMEYFCSSNVLLEFARHCDTGHLISDSKVEALLASLGLFRGIETQHQILFAAVDQMLFGKHHVGILDSRQATQDMLVRAQIRYIPQIPYVDDTFWITRFSHFVTYGAAYYSYTYSKAFAADIWHSEFKKNPLCRETGVKYKERILRHGGTKHPFELLESMLGRPYNLDAISDEIRHENDQ